MFFVETLENGTITVQTEEGCFVSVKKKYREDFCEDAYFFKTSEEETEYEISENVYHKFSNHGFKTANMKYVYILTGVDGTSLRILSNNISKKQYKYFNETTNQFKYFIEDTENQTSIEVSKEIYNLLWQNPKDKNFFLSFFYKKIAILNQNIP